MRGWAAAGSLSARTAVAEATQHPAQKPLPVWEGAKFLAWNSLRPRSLTMPHVHTPPINRVSEGMLGRLRSEPEHFCSLQCAVCTLPCKATCPVESSMPCEGIQ